VQLTLQLAGTFWFPGSDSFIALVFEGGNFLVKQPLFNRTNTVVSRSLNIIERNRIDPNST
jgi:hypothetical protein